VKVRAAEAPETQHATHSIEAIEITRRIESQRRNLSDLGAPMLSMPGDVLLECNSNQYVRSMPSPVPSPAFTLASQERKKWHGRKKNGLTALV
jgi:hypothetical protein